MKTATSTTVKEQQQEEEEEEEEDAVVFDDRYYCRRKKKKRVLVVGGGAVGQAVCMKLRSIDENIEIIVVDRRDYTEIGEGQILDLSSICQSLDLIHIENDLISFDLHNNRAVLDTGIAVKFDACLLVPSSSNSQAITRLDRLQQNSQHSRMCQHSNSILILGGSLLDAEIAGDLADMYSSSSSSLLLPNTERKRVTLVCPTHHLCPELRSPHLSDWIKDQLEYVGVNVVLNETATPTQYEKVLMLQRTRQEIHVDYVMDRTTNANHTPDRAFSFVMIMNGDSATATATATAVNPSSVSTSDSRTDKFCRISGSRTAFFLGKDCCRGTTDLAYASIVAQNIYAALMGQHHKLRPFPEKERYPYLAAARPCNEEQTGRFWDNFIRPFLVTQPNMFVFRTTGLSQSSTKWDLVYIKH